MNVQAKLKQVGPVGWVALTALAGVVFLCWHAYDRNPDDTSWTDPAPDEQPPENGGIPGVMDWVIPGTGAAFRSRSRPSSLASSRGSIIGEIG